MHLQILICRSCLLAELAEKLAEEAERRRLEEMSEGEYDALSDAERAAADAHRLEAKKVRLRREEAERRREHERREREAAEAEARRLEEERYGSICSQTGTPESEIQSSETARPANRILLWAGSTQMKYQFSPHQNICGRDI